jgi:hypothetical protein
MARASVFAALLLATGAASASAQSAIYGAGLQAWLGCWSADLSAVSGDAAPTIVCITPTTNVDVAEVLTVQDGRVVARDTLDATGRARPIGGARCTGDRNARWSNDGRRLFVHSIGTCAGVSSSTSGLLTMSTDGDWVDVEAVSAGGGASVRVARYKEVTPPSVLPAAARSALRSQALATRSLRAAASAPVRAEDVLEASRALDAAVVDAWILERAQRFDVTPTDFAALRNLGVSPRITDALGAVTDSESYTFSRAGDGDASGLAVASATGYDAWSAMPLGWGWGWGFGIPVRGRGAGYRHARPFGFYRPPLVIVRGHANHPPGQRGSGQGARPRGDGRGGAQPGGGASRPPAGDPRHTPTAQPSGDPRHAPPPQPSGGTVRLGRPRG